MLGVTRLLCATASPGDVLRYGRHSGHLPPHLLHYSADKRPVVVWTLTRRCNLFCAHCYTDSRDRDYPDELSTEEVKAVIDDLGAFGAPVILFSGGEPLLRPDILELIAHAQGRGIRAVLSTNGTLLYPSLVRELAGLGLSYVGISIDGPEHVHDRFRGKKGAFQEALRGLRACREAGLRVGIRVTLTRYNFPYLEEIFRLVEEEDIPRACFYHLAYAGRGRHIARADLSHQETREAVERIFAWAQSCHRRGLEKDILTVDNHADNVYLYLKIRREQPERAREVYQMLRWNGGNQSGIAIACIDNQGYVHPDQFSWFYSFGNVRQRPFSTIWTDTSDPVMAALKDRRGRIGGRCSRCRYFEICNGNLRARAYSYYGDLWAPDPACYLSDEELGIVDGDRAGEE